MVLEYMDQGSLHDFITERAAPFDPSMIAAVAYQMLAGLEYLHETCHMIHRDLKPPNVLLHSNGAVKLCDFGIAAIHNNKMSSQETSALNTTLIGTSRFMSPERLRGRPYGRSSDMWSLGLILLECVTGESCWKDVRSLVDLVITVEEAIIEDLIPAVVEEGLREIVLSCLKHQPGKSKGDFWENSRLSSLTTTPFTQRNESQPSFSCNRHGFPSRTTSLTWNPP